MNDAVLVGTLGSGDGYGANARISDPATCGEDLVLNLDLIVGVEEQYCIGCHGYHAWHGLDRVARTTKTGIDHDRPDLIERISRIVGELAASDPGRTIELVVAGSADTGILSTCAHAVWSLGEETASRVRYTVLDRCETPLFLCRAYGQGHCLAVRTQRTDFRDPLPKLPADLIILHSILSYIPAARHVGFLGELGSMLTPSGRVIVSNRLMNEQAPPRDARDVRPLVQEAVERGRIKPSVPVDKIMKSNEEMTETGDTIMHEFRNGEEIQRILIEAGLNIETATTIARERKRPAGEKTQYHMRFISVLSG